MSKQEYPKWMYGPDGQSKIFEKDEQVPKGWADHPSKVKEAKKGKGAADDGTTAEDRAATLASLREAGVEIADDATDDEINAAIDELTKNTKG